MKHPIVIAPDPILITPCRPVTLSDNYRSVAKNLCDSLKGHHAGFKDGTRFVGLSANQIGIDLRICVLVLEEYPDPIILVNPSIHHAKGYQVGPEMCLSQPGIIAQVRRRMEITVTCDHPDFPHRRRFSSFPARVAQHEIDHLDGILIEGTKAVSA